MDLSLLPLAFSLNLTVVRLLHSYSTDDKTSRLMVKRFSTVRDTQRGSHVTELHGEEKREEGDRGGQEETSQKGREQSSQ